MSSQYPYGSPAGSVAVDERTDRVYAVDNYRGGVLLFDSTAINASSKQRLLTLRRQRRGAVLRG